MRLFSPQILCAQRFDCETASLFQGHFFYLGSPGSGIRSLVGSIVPKAVWRRGGWMLTAEAHRGIHQSDPGPLWCSWGSGLWKTREPTTAFKTFTDQNQAGTWHSAHAARAHEELEKPRQSAAVLRKRKKHIQPLMSKSPYRLHRGLFSSCSCRPAGCHFC